MISTKKLLKLARKWQRLAAIRQRRITSLQTKVARTDTMSSYNISSKVDKGYFVVYSADQKHFLLPLEYLNSKIARSLFDMAKEEFGLPRKGSLTLPCKAELLQYAITLIKQQVTRDEESALLTSIASNCYSMPSQIKQIPICSF